VRVTEEARVIWTFNIANEGEVTIEANKLDGRAIEGDENRLGSDR
jgi:hypothetical protein